MLSGVLCHDEDTDMNENEWGSLALSAGADDAAVIPAQKIATSPVFREICKGNSCGMYGRCWMCPPEIGEIDVLIAQLKRYSHALIYQTVTAIEDSFDFEGMQAAGDAHAQLSRRMETVFPDIPHLHLSCGGCRLCERCAKADELPCRHPDLALASMEGYGIDVYQTVKNTPLRYNNGPDTVTFFGVVLFGEE